MSLDLREIFLQLGLKDGNIVSIEDVENGKACNCICPQCKSPLIARNRGKIKVHHFAHAADFNCIGAVETALHLLAKEILKNTKKIFIPNYKYFYSDLGIDSILLSYNKILTFDSVKLEERIEVGNDIIIADALCEIHGKKMIIEFARSHFIDDLKKKKLLNMGIACIEIPISNGSQNRSELTKELHSNLFKTVWIVNKKGEMQIEPNRIELIKQIQASKKRQMEEHERKDKINKEKLIKIEKADQERLKKEHEIRKVALDEASQKGNLILNCPINDELINEFGIKLNQSHNIVAKLFAAKEISPIYDRRPEFVDIFIDKERVILIPPGYPQMSANEKVEWDALLKIVSKVLDYRNRASFNPCNYCKCFKGRIYEFIICVYNPGISPQECFHV